MRGSLSACPQQHQFNTITHVYSSGLGLGLEILFSIVSPSPKECAEWSLLFVSMERERNGFFEIKRDPSADGSQVNQLLSLYRVDPPSHLSLYIWEDELKYIIGLLTTEKQVRLTSPYPFAASLFSPNIVTLHSSYLFSVRQNHVKKIYWCWSIGIRTHPPGPFSAMAGIRHADALLNIFNFDRRYYTFRHFLFLLFKKRN